MDLAGGRRRRNLLFDTAWWNTADQLALFAMIPPGQILFASDAPYGRTVARTPGLPLPDPTKP